MGEIQHEKKWRNRERFKRGNKERCNMMTSRKETG
jgi:hypothetical protein